MASFESHIKQAQNNLAFLIATNSSGSQSWDWQVTICFYTALHVVNAHMARKANLHYRTHEDVKHAINPYSKLSLCVLPENIYLAYVKLEGLSRRARYLCSDDMKNRSEDEFFTYDKHFAKAIKNLDILLDFFKAEYKLSYPPLPIVCIELTANSPLKIFKVAQIVAKKVG